MTHHSVMTTLLHIKNLKIDKFGNFSSDFDYNSKTDVFRDVVSLTINIYEPRCSKRSSGGHFMSASRTAQASEAH